MEQLMHTTRLYTGRILNLDRLTVQLPDGTPALREVVRTTGAAGVLAQSGERVLFVRQWRTPLGQETLELPAGRIEPGEAPLATAKRELNEEAQLAATNWHYLARVAQSAGFSDATITLYSATGLHRPANQRSQDVGEAVAGEWLTLAEALEAQAQGVICDAKTVIGLLHWQLKEAQHV